MGQKIGRFFDSVLSEKGTMCSAPGCNNLDFALWNAREELLMINRVARCDRIGIESCSSEGAVEPFPLDIECSEASSRAELS